MGDNQGLVRGVDRQFQLLDNRWSNGRGVWKLDIWTWNLHRFWQLEGNIYRIQR